MRSTLLDDERCRRISRRRRHIAEDGPEDAARTILSQANADGRPVAVGEECEVKMPLGPVAFRRGMVPGADEVGAFLERVIAARHDFE